MRNLNNIISWCSLTFNTDLRIISKIFLLTFTIYTGGIVGYFYFDFQREVKQNAITLEKKYKEFFSQAYLMVSNPQDIVAVINDMHRLLKFSGKNLIFKSIVVLYNKKTFKKKGLLNHSKYYKLLNNILLNTPQLVKKNQDTFFVAYKISNNPELIILGIASNINLNKYKNINQVELRDTNIAIDLYWQYLTQEAANFLITKHQALQNKLHHYINQYVVGATSLLFWIIVIYLYLRKYTNFKFKDLKIRLENKIKKVEACSQQIANLHKRNNDLSILLKAKKESHKLYLEFLAEIWLRIQNALQAVQANEELIINSGIASHIKLLIKQNLTTLASLEGKLLSCLNISEINISNLVKKLLTIFNYEILEKEIAFFPEVEKDFWVETDELLLSLILFQIIENSINRLSSNKFMTMHILERKGWINFLIIDEGYGVIPLYRKKDNLFFLEEEDIKRLAKKLGITISASQKKGINSTSIKIPNLIHHNSINPKVTKRSETNIIQLADYKK